jgi:YjbE family integral membrane protein
MPVDSASGGFGLLLQVVLLDLLLSGDNALIIALACRRLPDAMRRRAMWLGTLLAILLRFVLTAMTGFLLQVPLLKIVGGILLLIIGVKLLLADDGEESGASRTLPKANALGSAVMMIVSADLMLGLDNIVALAAVAQNDWRPLLGGLALSIPLLMAGSLWISRQLEHFPVLVPTGGVLLGWLGGQLIVGDPCLVDWISLNVPALTVVVPLLCAVYVPLQARIIRARRPLLGAPPPLAFASVLAAWRQQDGEEEEPVANAAPEVGATAQADPGFEPVPSSEPAASRPVPEPAAAAAAASEVPRLDNRLSLPLKIAIGIAAVIGIGAVLWIIGHLLSQGVLPPPQTPAN